MTFIIRKIFVIFLGAVLLPAPWIGAANPPSNRQQLAADNGWKFFLGDPANADAPSFNDSSWRTVDLPHDWSIEGIPEEKNPTASGGGFFPAGIGWYRKTFNAPAAWKGKRISVEFDGVSSNASIYLNGQKLGIHPYAYTSFLFDVTSQIKLSRANILAVRVDNSEQPASRWYGGAGIYRHVRVVVTDPIHVSPWGVFVSTPEVSISAAKVVVKTRVQNDTGETGEVVVRTHLLSPTGAASSPVETHVKMQSGKESDSSQEVILDHPSLWSPATPALYRAVIEIERHGKIVDRVETAFGVRSLSWSVDKGLSLNGSAIKLVGGSVHHDNGPLGAAAFDRAETRKVELLKAAGFNAVRTAHNPPSPAFLDACDRLGLLVLDEPFDVWTKSKAKYDYARFFKDWWQQDVDSMVLRDRNHPSIIFWGIGNEIPEAWTPEGAPIAKQLAARVRSLDTTRPLTEAFPGATYTAATDAVFSQLDIGGYNYNLAQNQAEDHRRVPGRIMMTTESVPAAAFENWQLVQEKPYILGEFVWTAMDYLGESGIGSWSYATPEQVAIATQVAAGMKQMMSTMGADGKNPFDQFAKESEKPNPMMAFMFPGYPWHAANSGDLDLTGFRKPASYYRDILWNKGNRVFATVRLPEPEGKKIVAIGWSVYPSLPSWTWPGHEGKDMQVEVYAGTEKVRLYLNDKLVSEMPTGREQEFKALFTVPFAPGKLKAVGVNGDREVAESILQTAGDAAQIRLTPDRAVLQADGQDLSFITVEALDGKGLLQPAADHEVRFTIDGPATIIAIGNGDGRSTESYQGDHRALFNGRALVIVRTSRTPGAIRLRASAPGLGGAEVSIQSQEADAQPQLP